MYTVFQNCKHSRRKVVHCNQLKPAKDLVNIRLLEFQGLVLELLLLHNGPDEVLEDEYKLFTVPHVEETSSQPQL